MAHDQGLEGSGGGTGGDAPSLRDRVLARLRDTDEGVRPDMARRPSGGGGSVKAGVARRLASGKLFGRGATVRTGQAGNATATKGASGRRGSISVRAGQRVVVKAFVARHGGLTGSTNPARAIADHVRYLARDGAGLDGEPGAFYGAEGELSREAVQEATGAWAEDRHHFRLIISPEHGDRIEDLQGYVREVMADVGSELKEPGLDWIAINHFDTDQPHAHVLIRGRRISGQTLVMPRRTISHTIRERAEARAQALLGDQSRGQAEAGLFVRARADRWTDIDMKLAALAERTGGVLSTGEIARRDTFGAIVRARVAHLEALGLATRGKDGVTFAPDLKARLDGLQRARDEIRSHWDRKRAQTFDGRQRPAVDAEKAIEQPKPAMVQPPTPERAIVQPAMQDRPAPLAPPKPSPPQQVQNYEAPAFPDPKTDRLIPADIVLASRGQGTGYLQRLDPRSEAHLAERARHLIATGQARSQEKGLAYSADTWSHLQRAELSGAVREQLGIAGREVALQPSVSEGRVVGHVSTALGRFAVVDRGIALAAVREMPGQELALGQVLGLGMQR